MHGYSTDPAELTQAAKALDDGAEEVASAAAELTGGAGSDLGPAGLDAAADAVLREQAELVEGIQRDLSSSATSAREVGQRYLQLEDDVREGFGGADQGGRQ